MTDGTICKNTRGTGKMAWVTQRRYDANGMDIWVARSFHQRYYMARRFCNDHVTTDENSHIEWRSSLCLAISNNTGHIDEAWRIVYNDAGSEIPINGDQHLSYIESIDGDSNDTTNTGMDTERSESQNDNSR